MSLSICKIRSAELLDATTAAARADQHRLIGPTHAVMSGSDIVGAITLMPSALVWMDTTRARARDSMALQENLGMAMSLKGERLLCMPCAPSSPFHGYLDRVGFVNLGSFDIFVKRL